LKKVKLLLWLFLDSKMAVNIPNVPVAATVSAVIKVKILNKGRRKTKKKGRKKKTNKRKEV
jgi:hypothetical protein